MKPIAILSHNILQCTLGTDQSGPIVQTATLAAIGQLPAFEYLLAKYWQLINNGALPTPPKDILPDIQAEWLTLQAVLAHYAYTSHLPFHPTAFASAITAPNIWLGQSYYRIRRLIGSDIPKTDITSAILLVAHYEVAAAVLAVEEAAAGLREPMLLNAEVFDNHAAERSHESV